MERHFDWDAAERILHSELADAEVKRDYRVQAWCHSNLGHVAEAQQRLGDAFRHWSAALALLDRLGSGQTALAIRLRHLMRRWHEEPRVWVSYSHRDAKRVSAVLRTLRRAKIEVISDIKFSAGHSILGQINAAMSRCAKFIVFWSANSSDSAWVEYERELLNVLMKRRRKDRSKRAFDNVVIFYCLGRKGPDGELRDDVQILEPKLGFRLATRILIDSIKTSEVLQR
jgi:hypothetical protein